MDNERLFVVLGIVASVVSLLVCIILVVIFGIKLTLFSR